jgi:putative Holliday junction resolvase
MRSGRRVAIDVGTVRVGVAACDFHAILASGLVTVNRVDSLEATCTKILEAINEAEPIEIYVGLPIALSGRETASTSDAVGLAKQLAAMTDIPVRMIDERMTTVTAANALRASDRSSKSGRSVIDQIAATIILEQAMSYEKKTGEQPGESLENY